MSKPTPLRAPPANRMLDALPKQEYQRLLRKLEPFPLVFGEIIYEPGDQIRHIYFPNHGIVSLLASVGDQSTLEVGLVGSEGMVGAPVILGVMTSHYRAVVQGAGSAWRMKATSLRKETANGGSLSRLLQLYMHSLLTQVSQSAVCNRYHSIDARLARWLLMTSDRMGTDEYQLTQEFLSNMLGVRREGVNKAAGILQRKKLIVYSRGTLKILNRAGVEAISCPCYRIIKQEYDAFLPPDIILMPRAA